MARGMGQTLVTDHREWRRAGVEAECDPAWKNCEPIDRHNGIIDEKERAKNRTKSKVRAKVEHAFFVIKRVFGFAKVRYRGLDKNAHRLFVACALANLFMARRHLMRARLA
jgi:IS5 family transposase